MAIYNKMSVFLIWMLAFNKQTACFFLEGRSDEVLAKIYPVTKVLVDGFFSGP